MKETSEGTGCALTGGHGRGLPGVSSGVACASSILPPVVFGVLGGDCQPAALLSAAMHASLCGAGAGGGRRKAGKGRPGSGASGDRRGGEGGRRGGGGTE